MHPCKSIGCNNLAGASSDFCDRCNSAHHAPSLSPRYSQQFRAIGDETELDAFSINQLFNINDPSGCLQFAIRELLMSSSASDAYDAVHQARDALTRWLQLNKPQETQ